MTVGDAVRDAFAPVGALVGERRLPGAVLGAVTRNGERAVAVDGFAQVEPTEHLMTRETMFDLASLTKPVLTTNRLLELIHEGAVGLDQPLHEVIPDLRWTDSDAPERSLTIRQCLTHQTFMPAHEPLYTLGLDPPTLEAYVLQRRWPAGPAVYSDINFILLGIVVQRVTGKMLAEQPLRDGLSFAPDPNRSAATERCPWRRRVLRGEVHDENAAAFGGVAGHAGLFGTADGLLDFALDMMHSAPDPCSPYHPLIREDVNQPVLGWNVPSVDWHGGSLCSQRCIGHTGFTGTNLCIDFELGIAWTLLTNRVHPTRLGGSVGELRPQVADLLIDRLQSDRA